MTTKCPMCGASEWHIWCETTAMYGPNNTTTYHCQSCGASWKDGALIAKAAPIEYEIQSKYGDIKDWLVENYANRKDVNIVYAALCQLLEALDDASLIGLR